MMSIRTRIFFLAFVTLSAVTIAFYIEYRDIGKRLLAIDNTRHVTNKIHTISELIHSLQKERGLSVNHLLGHDKELHNLYLKQCTITKSTWDKLENSNLLKKDKFATNFPNALVEIRQRIASGNVNWSVVRSFYTSTINNLLELQILEVASLEYSENISHELQSLFYLANTKENLGIVRATLNQGYSQGNLSTKELEYLIHHYGAFFDNHKIFKAISKAHIVTIQDPTWLAKIDEDMYYSVIAKIDYALNSEGKAFSGSASAWWSEVTSIIDTLKNTEDIIFEHINNHLSVKKEYYLNYLFWYGSLMFAILIIVVLLTYFAISRILKALYILISSLYELEHTKDYSLRIASSSRDEFDQISNSINNLLDYTDKIIKKKEFLATTDLLTGAMNRRSFIKASQIEIDRSERYNTSSSLIFCDIDFFKHINDQYSHSTGDRVLKEFAGAIMSNLRTNDYICRWGGEEFLIFATETNLDSAEKLAQKLRKKIMRLSIKPIEQQVTCSFGVAQRVDGESFNELCERADRALYNAKNTGRNKVCVSESTNYTKNNNIKCK
ncbi:MAG: diguanylate cyclase [Sulfurimonas sp.]|nr:diguanylate cyclase [Sulfurimonas sp.]